MSRPFLGYVPHIDSILPETHLGMKTRAFYTQGVFINDGLLSGSPGRLFEGFGYELHGLINFGRKGPLVFFDSYCEGDDTECGILTSLQSASPLPQDDIRLFPNPASDMISIRMEPGNQPEASWHVYLLNPMGCIVGDSHWPSGSELEMDVRHLQKGTYFLHIKGETIHAMRKLVIVHGRKWWLEPASYFKTKTRAGIKRQLEFFPGKDIDQRVRS